MGGTLSRELTFVIGPADEFSSVKLLSDAIQHIEQLLRNVDAGIIGLADRGGWRVVSLHSSAPTITVAPRRDDPEIVSTIGEGLRLIMQGTDQPPERFTEPVLEELKRMQRLYRGLDRAEYITVRMDGMETATIQSDIAEKANRILSAGHHNLGSVHGDLEVINVHKSPKATVWDRVSGAPVRWTFPRSELDRVKDLLGRRVLVSGDIHYFINGVPRSISNVFSIEDATPPLHEVKAGFGSIPDKRVRELGVTEWLRSIREEGRA